MSKAEILEELPKLKFEELAEVQAKLDELTGEAWLDNGDLSESDKTALDAALLEYQKNPKLGSSWDDVKVRRDSQVAPMMYRLIIRPEAETDISDAAAWYEGQEKGLGDEFLAEVDLSLKRTLTNPRQWQCLRRRPDVRRILTRRFPYRLFFILRRDAVIVFRALHNARGDQEWVKAIPRD